MQWFSGLNNFKEHTLSDNIFHINYQNVPLHKDFTLEEIYLEHLSYCNKKFIEVIYSGGLDSEAIILVCLKNKIPVKARTVKLYFDGLLVNGYDLYHVDQFCRAYKVEVEYMELDLVKYYMSPIDIDLCTKYGFNRPYASITCWALGHANGYAMVGGDYPWPYRENNVWKIKPPTLGVNSYDRFLKDNNLDGIGNMQTHSLTSLYLFIKTHIETYDDSLFKTHNSRYNDFYFEYFKNNFFKKLGLEMSFRFKQHGFEHLNRYRKYHDDITSDYFKNFPMPKYSATFPDVITQLLD